MPAPVSAAAAWKSRVAQHGLAKPLVWLLCLAPLAWLVWRTANNQLGANPAEALIRGSGDWALRLLCVALAVTPLRQALSWPALARFRRLIGLFAFFYALLHAICYAWFDMGWDWGDIGADLAKRPFILVGALTALVLAVLAATSPPPVVRRLGGRRWQRLHRSVYAAGLLALLHFYWMRSGKNDVAEVFVYLAIVAALLGWRVVMAWRKRQTQGAARAPSAR